MRQTWYGRGIHVKRTQVADLFANIKKSFVSFFSILMFAALGVGVFLGISWAAPALQNAAQKMLDEGSFHSFQIQFPYGLTDDDLKKLLEVEGVTQVEPAYLSYQTLVVDGGKSATVKVQSLGQDIDAPIVVEGELPTKPDEMAFHAESAKQLGVQVGDTVTFVKDAEEGGDDFTLSSDGDGAVKENPNTSGMKYLTNRSLKVTGIVNSPDYLADSEGTYGIAPTPSGAVNGLAWVPDSSYDASAFQDGHPIVNVRCDGILGLDTFSEDYKARSKEIESRIAELGDGLATARYDDLHGQAQREIDDAQAQINDAEARIAQGEQDVADGEKRLEDGRAELERKRAEGQAELDDAYAQLMSGEAAKAEGERKLANARSRVDEGQREINAADDAISSAEAEVADAKAYKKTCDKELSSGKISQKEYNKRLDKRGSQATDNIQPLVKGRGISVPKIDHENYEVALEAAEAALANAEDIEVTVEGEKMTLGEARKRLESAKEELSSAQAEYDQKVAELNNGWSQYYEGQATLEREVANAEQQLADGEAQLEEARRQIDDGKRQVDENKPKLEDAKAKLAEMSKYDWTLLPRSHNAGYGEVVTFSSVTDSLSISMAALFIIVGLLVSYFAVSRIVREQITQIGTKKALGFRQGEITISYLCYSGIAVLVGAIFGAIMGYVVVEGIIGMALSDMFAFGTYPAYFGWGLFLAVTLAYLALVLGTTYLACRGILKEHAVELLKGPKPPTGKMHLYEKWGIWDKLPLLIQTIVNNCVNEKRRMLSTIVGVAGATALIVTAITLNNDVLKSYDRQYEKVYGFNAITYVDSTSDQAADNVEAALQGQGAETAQAFMKILRVEQPNGDSGLMHVISSVDAETFARLYHVNPVSDGTFDPTAEGAWVSQAYAEHFGAKVGDMLLINDGKGAKHEIPILGFYEFWLTYHEAVISHDYLEKEFGATTPNVVLANTGDIALSDVESAISGVEGYSSIVDDATMQHVNFEMFSSVSGAVVAIYLALAALMAVVVLLNLNVMFIEEKKRELIVLMINGFSVKDARHYISYDNIVLTALGIVAGIVLGCIMGSITVAAIEPSTGVFVKSPDGWAIAIGILGSAVLAIIMGLIALRRIDKFNLTDINRF